jgi:hypothetical protein
MSKVALKKFTVIYSGDRKPQFMYIGIIDAKHQVADMA